MNRQMPKGHWWPCFLILLQSLLYAIGDPFIVLAFKQVPIYSLLSIRYILALAILLAFAGKRVKAELKKYPVRVWLLPSLCMSAAFIVGNTALDLGSTTSVSFLRSLSTLMTPILAFIVYRRKFSLRHVPVQLTVIVGLYLLCAKGGLNGFGIGEALALVTALLLSAALVFGEQAMTQMDSLTMTTAQIAISAIMTTACAFLLNGGWNLELMTPGVWGNVAYQVIICSLVGYMLNNLALSCASARAVSLLQCSGPVMTAFSARFILGEQISVAGIVGAAIILACVAAETFIEDDAKTLPEQEKTAKLSDNDS